MTSNVIGCRLCPHALFSQALFSQALFLQVRCSQAQCSQAWSHMTLKTWGQHKFCSLFWKALGKDTAWESIPEIGIWPTVALLTWSLCSPTFPEIALARLTEEREYPLASSEFVGTGVVLFAQVLLGPLELAAWQNQPVPSWSDTTEGWQNPSAWTSPAGKYPSPLLVILVSI